MYVEEDDFNKRRELHVKVWIIHWTCKIISIKKQKLKKPNFMSMWKALKVK